jgi:hypothetical protein
MADDDGPILTTTLAMVKPDAAEHADAIIELARNHGFTVISVRLPGAHSKLVPTSLFSHMSEKAAAADAGEGERVLR